MESLEGVSMNLVVVSLVSLLLYSSAFAQLGTSANIVLPVMEQERLKRLQSQTAMAKRYVLKSIFHTGQKRVGLLESLGLIAGDYDFLEYEGLRQQRDRSWMFGGLFSGNFHKMRPSFEHSLAFTNSDGSMSEFVTRDFGFCAGFSTVTRKLNLGLYFDPQGKFTQRLVLPDRSDRNAWIQYYKRIISDVLLRSRLRLVPYYANLKELSGDQEFPEIASYIRQVIAAFWSYHNINSGGIRAVLSTANKSIRPFRQLDKLYQELTNRLAAKINPIYYISKPSDSVFSTDHWIHVLQAYEVSPRDDQGGFTIKFWDINYSSPTSMRKDVVIVPVIENGKKRVDAYFDGEFISGLFEIKRGKLDITTFFGSENLEPNVRFCLKYSSNEKSICHFPIDQL